MQINKPKKKKKNNWLFKIKDKMIRFTDKKIKTK